MRDSNHQISIVKLKPISMYISGPKLLLHCMNLQLILLARGTCYVAKSGTMDSLCFGGSVFSLIMMSSHLSCRVASLWASWWWFSFFVSSFFICKIFQRESCVLLLRHNYCLLILLLTVVCAPWRLWKQAFFLSWYSWRHFSG